MFNNNANPAPTLENDLLITGEYIPIDWLLEEPPAHEFCVDPYLPIGAITIVNGHGGVGKSLFALKMATHITLGIPILNARTNGGKVAYMSLEDSEVVFRQRFHKVGNTLPRNLVPRLPGMVKKLMFINRYGIPTDMANLEQGCESEIPAALVALLKEHDIKCLVVDTLIRTHSLNENDNAQMGALLGIFEQIAKEAECAVILIHHQPKAIGKGTGNSYASRGASAITDNARSVLSLEKVLKKEADKFNEENIRIAAIDGRLVRVEHTKHNYSAGHPDQYFEISRDGVPIERLPTINESTGLKLRYAELFAWCQSQWAGKPITKTNIDDHYAEMRPNGTSYGKTTYKKALQWAVDEGYAVKASPPDGASKNPKAEYYALSGIDEDNPPTRQ